MTGVLHRGVCRSVRALSWPVIRWHVTRRVVGVEGLENLPESGGFVLAPNHASYYDHFLLLTVLRAVRPDPLWFLTKAEAFASPPSRVWHEAWRSIPVDRSRPSSEMLRTVRALLQGGGMLCAYPEGTRGPGDELLPFKDGPFRFADLAGVPVVPAALVGTAAVLPRGSRRPRRGRVSVAFAPPLTAPSDRGRPERTQWLRDEARAGIGSLLGAAAGQAAPASATRAAELVDRRIAAKLDGHGRLGRDERRRLALLTRLARRGGRDVDLMIQAARLRGLRALSAPRPLRAVLAAPVGPALRRALRHQPDHPLGNYLLGRWHLTVPRLLGGGSSRALTRFERSDSCSVPGDTRAMAALAETHLGLGDVDAARAALTSVIARTSPEGRGVGRIERATRTLSELEPASAGRGGA